MILGEANNSIKKKKVNQWLLGNGDLEGRERVTVKGCGITLGLMNTSIIMVMMMVFIHVYDFKTYKTVYIRYVSCIPIIPQ